MVYRKQNYKSVGDKWAEGSDEWSVLHTGKDYGDSEIRSVADVCEVTERVDWSLNEPTNLGRTWAPGALPFRGGRSSAPKHDTYTTKPVDALSKTSKGQRKTLGGKRGDYWEE